mmetsp:Transcript_16574/g.23272  ORF Transcript_16574/g.23272 Transcript_16574/m.23272 type:complete len:289 (-) Transcript_16574:78-944(-)|eukprot:CAMPEP_0175093816 /NCGR_PEP_ID=MMETSP0086_2-20121207/3234_1 /TAXON_ID=136419 /ORGANISM="Unknown Unknown, Strain D1" /LENGTH=288 /DNA_ID=CAMNT_0016366843 /DNA_START=24 /DNA_END=890 /DNA_ORIENTATION=+
MSENTTSEAISEVKQADTPSVAKRSSISLSMNATAVLAPSSQMNSRVSSAVGSLTRKFGAYSQWTKFMAGKAPAVQEPKEFSDMLKRFQADREEISNVLLSASGLLSSTENSISQDQAVTSSLAKLGSHSKTESKSNEVVQTYVPFALQLGGLQKELNAKLRELIVDPLTDLVNEINRRSEYLLLEAENSKYLVANLTAQVEANSGLADHNYKKQQTIQKLEEAQTLHSKSKEAITDLCSFVETRKRMILTDNLQDYVQAQSDFFSTAKTEVEAKMTGAHVARSTHEG